MRWLAASIMILAFTSHAAADGREALLDLARKGWSYELRTTMIGRDMSIPVLINGRQLAGAALCVVGEEPHPETLVVLEAFRALIAHSYGKPVGMRHAGADASRCGTGRVVVLRLYSGHPPRKGLSQDIDWLNRTYALGLPQGRTYVANTPALAQTFFGRLGMATHLMVMQPPPHGNGPVEAAFFRSILIEELYQAFTFGMDILVFDRSERLVSKLQETPVNLRRLPWGSREFMLSLLQSNPRGLCAFDVLMLHAVGEAPVDQTVDPAFIDFIDEAYDSLLVRTRATLLDERFSPLLDAECALVD